MRFVGHPAQDKREAWLKFLLANVAILLIFPLAEAAFYRLSFHYEVYKDLVSWYFPVGLRLICFIFFPIRYWPALLLGGALGQILYSWLAWDRAFEDMPRRVAYGVYTQLPCLVPLFILRLRHIKIGISSLRSVALLLGACLFYRISRSPILMLTYGSPSPYGNIPESLKFEMIMAHQLGGIVTILIMLIFAYSLKSLKEKWKGNDGPIWAGIPFQLTLVVILVLGIYLLEPKTIYLLRMLAIFPLIWFCYRFGARGTLSYAAVINTLLLAHTFGKNQTELLLTTQLYIISYSVLALMLSALMEELNLSKQKLQNSNRELQSLSEQTKSLANRVISVQESERYHLSQELHDDIGQNLTALRTHLSILERKSEGYSLLSHPVDRLKVSSDRIYDSVYRLMHWLRPRLVDELGLSLALKSELFTESLENIGITYLCEVDKDVDELPEEYVITLFRICQEATTNVIKYSHASEFSIRLTLDPKNIRLVIEDDGDGISDLDTLSESKSGFGLDGIQGRVSVLSGQSEISNKESGGLMISIIIPTPIKP